MSFFKSLWADLVEKRLWPVAAVLLLALVAVPVVLARGGEEVAAAPLGATGAAGPAELTAQVALDPIAPTRSDRAGAVRDPFKQRKLPKAPAAATATAVATAPASGTPATPSTSQGPSVTPQPSSPSAGGSAGSGPTPTTPATPTPPRPKADRLDSYVVTLRFGRTGSDRSRRTVERLTPLPSAENPFFVYLGALSDRRTAVFLLSSDVKATGEGACKPRASSCEIVELRRGDTELLDVTGADGKVTQYQLDVLLVSREREAAARQAVAARHAAAARRVAAKPRAKPAKKEDPEELGTDRYAYDDATGLLHRVKRSAAPRAHLPSVSDGSATAMGAPSTPPGFRLGAEPTPPVELSEYFPGS